MNLKTAKIHKELRWTLPYLDSVSDLVPVDRIIKLTYFKSRNYCLGKSHVAITHKLMNNKSFEIFIRTNLDRGKRIPLSTDCQENYLSHLAHELAHMVHWEHGRDHIKLTGVIFNRFTKLVHKIGFEKERNKCS